MTIKPIPISRMIKRRQYLLISGVGLLIIGAAAIGVAITSGGKPVLPTQTTPTTVQMMTPGSQVDPQDVWTATAGAEIRGLTEKNRVLEDQSRDMLDRLKRLEAGRDNPRGENSLSMPEATVTLPASDPMMLPPATQKSANSSSALIMPPGTPPAIQTANPSYPPNMAKTNPIIGAGLVTLSLANSNVKDSPAKDAKDSKIKQKAESKSAYLPAGAFARAVLLGGIDAPTGGQAQRNPQPVLMRLQDNAILPNRYRYAVKECFVVGAAYGDISSERAYIRTENLSCVTPTGEAIDIPLHGYVAGEDGKAGMRGRLVSKQGQILANALMAGVVSGIGQGFRDSSTSTAISPLGSVQSTKDGKAFETGVASGVGKALDRLAQYYITLAEKTFPVIEIDAARQVEVIVTKGIAIDEFQEVHDSLVDADTE